MTTDVQPTVLNADYEYAGFHYAIMELNGEISAVPLADQHYAANRDKHKRAAVECWQDDGRPA